MSKTFRFRVYGTATALVDIEAETLEEAQEKADIGDYYHDYYGEDWDFDDRIQFEQEVVNDQ